MDVNKIKRPSQHPGNFSRTQHVRQLFIGLYVKLKKQKKKEKLKNEYDVKFTILFSGCIIMKIFFKIFIFLFSFSRDLTSGWDQHFRCIINLKFNFTDSKKEYKTVYVEWLHSLLVQNVTKDTLLRNFHPVNSFVR